MTIIIAHTASAFGAFLLAILLLLIAKGTPTHRLIGRIFAALMVFVAMSSFFIREINDGDLSLIHILIPVTIGSLMYGIMRIRQYKKTGDIEHLNAHNRVMKQMVFGTLVVAGLFAFFPGRLLHTAIFG